jgi:hypothetical protein
MAMTVEEIDASITALLTAMGSGTLRARFADGREVTYRSADDMAKQVTFLRQQRATLIAGDAAPIARPRFFIINAVR